MEHGDILLISNKSSCALLVFPAAAKTLHFNHPQGVNVGTLLSSVKDKSLFHGLGSSGVGFYWTVQTYILSTTIQISVFPGVVVDPWSFPSSSSVQGIWRIPVDEIDRPGSFASHMNRSIVLLLEVLYQLKDHDTLLKVSFMLHRTPDQGK